MNCPTGCAWCGDGGNNNQCYTCSYNYYLVYDELNICNNRFSFDFSYDGSDSGCASDYTCYDNSCPMYHFKKEQSLTGSYTYFTEDNVQRYYYQSSSYESPYNLWPKRNSDVCIPC